KADALAVGKQNQVSARQVKRVSTQERLAGRRRDVPATERNGCRGAQRHRGILSGANHRRCGNQTGGEDKSFRGFGESTGVHTTTVSCVPYVARGAVLCDS